MSMTTPTDELARCNCGHDRHHSDVQEKARYGFWGWLALAMGATVVPRRLDYVCTRCRVLFDSSSDRKETERHV